MRPGGVQAFEYSDLRDELAWLVLRVLSKLEPCTETSLVAYITGNYTPSQTLTAHVILNALIKLKALGLIQSAEVLQAAGTPHRANKPFARNTVITSLV